MQNVFQDFTNTQVKKKTIRYRHAQTLH